MPSFHSAFITGATSGIGERLAFLLAKKKGIPLLLVGRNGEKLKQLEDSLSAFAAVKTLQADFAKKEDLEKTLACVQQEVPDLLILNAGFGVYGKAVELSFKEQKEMVDVNVVAVQQLALTGAQALLNKNKQGTILTVSSIAGEFPTPGRAVYGATKAFVTSFSKALDFELSSQGIRVLTCCPGQVETAFAARAAKKPAVEVEGITLSASYVAEKILKQIEKGKRQQILDWRYRFLGWIAKKMPENLAYRQIYKSIEKRL